MRDSDGTLIISRSAALTGGSAYTARCAERLGRKISPTAYSAAELKQKRSGKSGFVTRVMEQPKIFVIGSELDLEKS